VGDICSTLSRLHRNYVPKPLAPYFRDVQDHVLQVIRSMDVMRESLTDAMQVNLALVSMRQNEVVKRLAGWGAILALPTMVFSLYGMNFRHMPELDFPYGYPAALGFTTIGCLIIYRRLRVSCWL
jgi:magnesium transporter